MATSNALFGDRDVEMRLKKHKEKEAHSPEARQKEQKDLQDLAQEMTAYNMSLTQSDN